MSNLRRHYYPGQVYFTTHVTHGRRPVLSGAERLLLSAFGTIRSRRGFHLLAWVILPDHFHAVIQPGAVDLSAIFREVKQSFSQRYRLLHREATGRLWQYRFWDHVIRDDDDLQRHFDYIHHNPVKHGYAETPGDYGWSSFYAFLRRGMYGSNWSAVESGSGEDQFGE